MVTAEILQLKSLKLHQCSGGRKRGRKYIIGYHKVVVHVLAKLCVALQPHSGRPPQRFSSLTLHHSSSHAICYGKSCTGRTLAALPQVTSSSATYLVETGHRLIRRSDLHLEERSFHAVASVLRTLHLALLGVVPGLRSSKDILSLWAGECLALIEASGQDELVWTCAAFHAVLAREFRGGVAWRGAVWDFGDGEDVAAVWADYSMVH